MGTYTIGEIARRSGFSTSALRYYEKHGLVAPAGRTEADYRIYDDATLDRLTFIDRAKQLGCTLEEIRDLATLWDDRDCGPVQARLHELVTEKLDEVRQRTTELTAFTGQLRTAAAHLGEAAADGACHQGCACMTTAPPGRDDSTPVVLGERPSTAIACSLPAPEQPARVTAWQEVLHSVTARSRTAAGALRLEFDEAAPLEEVVRLATAEQDCCSFFAFAITVDQRGSALEVSAPPGADDVVATVFGAPS